MRFLKKTNINFISKQKFTAFLSTALIIAGLASLVSKGGPLLSIDFTGGTVVQVKFENLSNQFGVIFAKFDILTIFQP